MAFTNEEALFNSEVIAALKAAGIDASRLETLQNAILNPSKIPASESSAIYNGVSLDPAGIPGAGPFTARLYLAADVSTGANVTPVSVAGISFPYLANAKYLVDGVALIQSPAATTGAGLQWEVSSPVTFVGGTFYHQLANTGTVTGGSSITGVTSTGVSSGVPTAATVVPAHGAWVLVTGASGGTAQLRIRSESAAVTTIKANSLFRIMRMA